MDVVAQGIATVGYGNRTVAEDEGQVKAYVKTKRTRAQQTKTKNNDDNK